MSISVLASAAPRTVFAVLADLTTVGLDEIVVHDGNPDPALVSTCPLVPAAPARVKAVVRLADAIVGAVSVLLVSVSVVALPTKVSVLVGRVKVPVLLMLAIIGVVNVLLVSVSVPVGVT